MKVITAKIENGTIKVVRNKSQYDKLNYEPCETREREVKEMLRKRIASLENNWKYEDEYKGVYAAIYGGDIMQR